MHDDAIDTTSSAQAREDVLAMFRQMPAALGALVLVYFLATMAWFAAPAIVPTWVGHYVLRMLMFMGLAYAAAPVMLSLYRFVALGDAPPWMPSLTFDDTTHRFAAYASLLTALYFAPALGREVLMAFGWEELAVLTWFALCAAVWVAVIRSTTLLPMAALDPRSASWSRAVAQSKGRTLRIFMATTIPAAPASVALLILAVMVARGAVHPVVFYPAAILTLLAIQLLPLAVATRLYLSQRQHETESGR